MKSLTLETMDNVLKKSFEYEEICKNELGQISQMLGEAESMNIFLGS